MICQFHRFRIDQALDDGRQLSARTARHLTECHACQQHYAVQRSIIRHLQAEAQPGGNRTNELPLPIQSPAFLRARILNELKSDPGVEVSTNRVPWAWLAGAIAAVALMAALFPGRQVPTAELQDTGKSTSGAAEASAVMLELGTRFADGGQLLQLATNIDHPLQNEMNLVIQDARTALRSLQSDFIPATLLAKSE